MVFSTDLAAHSLQMRNQGLIAAKVLTGFRYRTLAAGRVMFKLGFSLLLLAQVMNLKCLNSISSHEVHSFAIQSIHLGFNTKPF